MLEKLLESEAKKEKSVAGTLVSVTAHTALIAAALYATAQARPEPARSAEMVRPVFFPLPKRSIPKLPHVDATPQRLDVRPLAFIAPRLDLRVPAVDITALVSKPGDFRSNAITVEGANNGDGTTVGLTNVPYLADQVEREASVAAGNAPPRYPELLRSSGVEGRVIAEFIVDEHGRAEQASVRFLQSDNPLFQDAVRGALGRMRFVPAQVGGRNVRQLVQMPFVFTLQR